MFRMNTLDLCIVHKDRSDPQCVFNLSNIQLHIVSYTLRQMRGEKNICSLIIDVCVNMLVAVNSV